MISLKVSHPEYIYVWKGRVLLYYGDSVKPIGAALLGSA